MSWQILGPLAGVLAALGVAAWWFVLRLGRRVSPTRQVGADRGWRRDGVRASRAVGARPAARGPRPPVGADDRGRRRGAARGARLLSADARGHRARAPFRARHAVRLPAGRDRRPVRAALLGEGGRWRRRADDRGRPRQPCLHRVQGDVQLARGSGRRSDAPRPGPTGSARAGRLATARATPAADRARRAPQARARRRRRRLRGRSRSRGSLLRRALPRRLHPLHRADHPAAAGNLPRELRLPRRPAARWARVCSRATSRRSPRMGPTRST